MEEGAKVHELQDQDLNDWGFAIFGKLTSGEGKHQAESSPTQG